jgi:AsmA family protein
VRLLKWTAAIFLLLVAAAFAGLYFTGLNGLRDPIARLTADKTGRELRIEGDLRLVWSWVHPRIRAEQVSFTNAHWAKADYLFTAEAAELTVSVLPLLAGKVVLPDVHLVRAVVNLEQDEEGRKNWVLKDDPEPGQPSRVQINALTLDHGRLAYRDAGRDINIQAELSSDDTGVAFKTRGRYNGMQLAASGHGGPVLEIRDNDNIPYPLKAEAKIGNTAASFDGTITGLVGLSGIDMAIQVSGKSMDELYKVLGIAFPSTPPYSTAGRLIRAGKVTRYEKFTGKVGDSDLAGTLQVDAGGKRPVMQGDLVSKVLDLADLGPAVGTKEPKKEGVLPDAPFEPARWDSVDADVKLRAGTIRRPEQLPLEHFSTRIRMNDAVLSLDPLEFGLAGGKLAGTIRLDGREETIKADTKLRAQKLKFGELFPTIDVARASVGDLSGAIELSGRGNSVAKMLGSANGKIGMFMDGGKVSNLLMQMVAIDLWGITRVKLKGDEQIEIRCVVADFGVKDGMMEANALVFDTAAVNIGGSGHVNLKNEELDLTLLPEPKDGSIASLRSPLFIRGKFSGPKVRPDVGRMVARGAGAAVLAIVNPLLVVVPLIDDGPGKDSNCGQLIAELTPVAKSADRKAAKSADRKAAAATASKPAPSAATSSDRSAASGGSAPRLPKQPEY